MARTRREPDPIVQTAIETGIMTAEEVAEGVAKARIERLEEARRLQAEFGTTTEALNARLGEAEAEFVAMNLGVAASVPLEDDSGDQLAFMKNQGNWGLYILRQKYMPVALLKASRQDRVSAARVLPELLDKLIERLKIESSEVESGIATVGNLLSQIRGAR